MGLSTSVQAMITNVSLVTVYVTDHEPSRPTPACSGSKPAPTPRWATTAGSPSGSPISRELEVTLMLPGPPLDDEMAQVVRRALADGRMGSLGLKVNNCQKTYEDLTAKGVEFPQPPSDRPYGVEAVMRDNSGNWLVLVEPKSGD